MPEIRVYVTTFCGYCVAAKRLLNQKGVPFQEINCSGDAEVRQWLLATTGQRTVPQIFIGDVPIGGYSELAALEKSGQLDRILAGEATARSVAAGG
jgi:glutaredoxin 3